jgi:hypothetical protein
MLHGLTTHDPTNCNWTDDGDTDLITYTRYNANSTVTSTVSNYVDGVFTATALTTDPVMHYSYDLLADQRDRELRAEWGQVQHAAVQREHALPVRPGGTGWR